MSSSIRTYAELVGCMREALRDQHPDWVGPHGESALCDFYVTRLTMLLDLFATRVSEIGLQGPNAA